MPELNVAFIVVLFVSLMIALTSILGSISAAYSLGVTVTETLTTTDDPFIDTSDAVAKFKLLASGTLNSGSSPDAELMCSMQKAMSAGAGTLDLTSLTHRGAAVSFSGKKVRLAVLRNPGTNGNAITLTEGASNGIPLFGTSFSITLQPGEMTCFYLGDTAPTVSGSDKTIDLAGTLAQALDVLMVAG